MSPEGIRAVAALGRRGWHRVNVIELNHQGMTPQQLDRWLLNNVFARSRVFRVALESCVDEFGNHYDGSHFFTRALAHGEDFDIVLAYLKQHYAENRIRSFNDVVGHRIEDPAGDQYFCPWEAGRIRALAKFAASHKIGPTPDEALEPIVKRLLGVLAAIRAKGFRQRAIIDGFPQVIPIVDRHQRRRFILRDGQHRAAVLSYLGYPTMLVCHTRDHWRPSSVYRAASGLLKVLNLNGAASTLTEPPLREVREDAIEEWPHVRAGRVTVDDARRFFQSVFARAGQPC